MKIVFEASFARDLKKIQDKVVLYRVEQAIANVKEAGSLQDILNFSKLSGYAHTGDHWHLSFPRSAWERRRDAPRPVSAQRWLLQSEAAV